MALGRARFGAGERGQVSLEFILITGGIIAAALTIFMVRGSIRNFANVISNWVDVERNQSISTLTR